MSELDELLGIITRVVSEAGGRVDNVERHVEDGLVMVDLSGLPEGPLRERVWEAARELAKVGIYCQIRTGEQVDG